MNSNKDKPLLKAQEKFPGCIFLVSISFMKRTSSFLRFTDFLLVAFSAKFKGKNLCKISKWELSRCPKVTKHRYAITILYFLTNIKLETRKFNISEGEWSLSWFEKSVNFKFGRSIEVYFFCFCWL